MSRHRGAQKAIDEALAGEDDYDDYDDDYELTEEDHAFIDELWRALDKGCPREEVQYTLDKNDWDGDLVFDVLSKKIAKQKTHDKKQQIKNDPKKHQESQAQLQQQTESKNVKTVERKDSEDDRVIHRSISVSQNSYINKENFNQIYPNISYKTQSKDQNILNVAVAGHVDSGKSTLVGHLLYLTGAMDKTGMHKLEKESQTAGKLASKFAWMLDEREQERARGITIDIGMKSIQTDKRQIVLIDCPGHKDFVTNMMLGAAQADVGLLVVDVVKNAFEAGFSQGGQTKEHALILKSMGVAKVVVVYNKMDYVSWSQERYFYASGLITTYLQEIGFHEEDILEIPVSGLQGQNVYKRHTEDIASWYEGPTLIELLEEVKITKQAMNKPLRMNISSVYQSTAGKIKGLCITGKIIGGVIEKNGKYVIMPYGVEVSAKDLLVNEEKQDAAHLGENPIISLKLKDQDIGHLGHGQMLCDASYPIPVAKKFRADILIFDYDYPLIKGERVQLHINLVKCSAVISKILAILDKTTNEPVKKNPKVLKSGQLARVEITCEQSQCMELFENFTAFGRITIRERGESVASGQIIEILE